MSSNTYSFVTANVVIGESSVPGYAFRPRAVGVLGLDQVGDTARVEIDGNVDASGLRLIRDGVERVFISGANGDLATSSYPGASVGNATHMEMGILDPARISGDYTMGELNVPGTLTTPEIGGNINASTVVSGVLDPQRLAGTYTFNSLSAGGVIAATAVGNLDTSRVVDGTVHPDRMTGGQYSFESLVLSGNLDGATVNANVDTGLMVDGVLDNDRLVGAYTVSGATASTVVANTIVLSDQAGGRGLVAVDGNVVTSSTTTGELAFLHGLTGTIQPQLDNFRYGLFDGNLLSNLNGSQVTLGRLHDDRLAGSYTFDDLVLGGGLDARSIDANLNASVLTSGLVDPSRIVGDYTHLTNLDVTGTLDAASVDAGLDATDLTSGAVGDAFLDGTYAFESLTTATANAAWVSGNIDTRWLSSGTIPQERFDFESLASNLISAGSYLGTSTAPWHEASWGSVDVDDLEIGSAIRFGGKTMQLDLERTASSIVPVDGTLTIGTPTVPWSNIHGTDLRVDQTMIVEGGIVDETGNSLSFNLEQVPMSILPVRDGFWFGTNEKPWGPVRTDGLVSETFDGTTVTTSLRSSDATGLGSATKPWSNVFTANAVGALDGNGVGDIWAQVDVASGAVIEALDGIHLPSEVAAFRFLDDETTGLGLRGGTTPGGVDVTVGGTTMASIETGSVTHTGTLAPSVDATHDLGGIGTAWRDVYAANIHTPSGGRIGDDGTITTGGFEAVGNVNAPSVVASGSVEATTLVGSLATSNLTGTVDDARFGSETYTVANLDVDGNALVTGSLTCGNLVPSGNAVYDLGSASNRFRDLYVSNGSIQLGTVSISEEHGNVTVSSNVLVTDRVYGNIRVNPIISNIQITDASWNIVDDTALPPDGGKFLLNGSGLAPGSLCMVGNTFASSTSYVSPTQLRVQVPAKSVGSYDVHVVRPDSKSVTLPSGVTFSNAVTWITSSTLGNVYQYLPFNTHMHAVSDSSLVYSNVTPLPTEAALDPVTGNLTGNITTVFNDTVFSFQLSATDQELQSAIRSFLLNYVVFSGAKIYATTQETSAEFGVSCAMDATGDRLCVGVRNEDVGGVVDAGVCYVFVRSGSSWVLEAKLQASDAEASAYLGISCAMNASGDTICVGAYYDDANGQVQGGACYIYVRSGSTWSQQQKIQADPVEAYAIFGYSCAMDASGDRVCIGSHNYDSGGISNSGACYVFVRNDSSWSQEARLQSPTLEVNGYFGWSCTLDAAGDRLCVGSILDDAGGVTSSGACYVFARNASTWTFEAKLQASDLQIDARFGWSCAMNVTGDRVCVGAINGNGVITKSGTCYVFARVNGTWVEEAKIQTSDVQFGSSFGYSCAINDVGDRICIGAYRDDTGGVVDSGSCFIFTRDGSTWTQTDKIQADDTENGAKFGVSCAMNASGDRLCVGANLSDTGVTDSGSCYVFQNTYLGYKHYFPRGQLTSPQVIGGETFSRSSVNDVSNDAANAFDSDYTTQWVSGYKYTNGVHNNTTSTTVSGVDRYGEWLQVQFTQSVPMKRMAIRPAVSNLAKAPKNFVIAGSNDGTTWTEVIHITEVPEGYGNYRDTNFDINSTNFFTYYRIIAMELNSTSRNTTNVRISEWKIFDA